MIDILAASGEWQGVSWPVGALIAIAVFAVGMILTSGKKK